jgi:DNA (cytosine-5)-methyltransferase 1
MEMIDLFAGCGGLALGFAQAGFTPLLAVEADERAAATYARNMGEHVICQDIGSVHGLPRAQIVVGGPPCQGFSRLGNGQGSEQDARNQLWRQYVRMLSEARPQVFVMENVPELLKAPAWPQFMRQVKRMGYTVDARVLLASDYGVPQHRRRAFVIGALDARLIAWPQITHGDAPDLQPLVTVRDALQGLPLVPDGRNWHIERPRIHENSRTRYQHVPADGGNRMQMARSLEHAGLGELVPACWRGRDSHGVDVFGRLWWDRPSVTIRTEFHKPEKGRYLHPSEHRPITLREGARLQTLPDEFAWPEDQTMSHVARQIGNAVPPLLATAIARALAARC